MTTRTARPVYAIPTHAESIGSPVRIGTATSASGTLTSFSLSRLYSLMTSGPRSSQNSIRFRAINPPPPPAAAAAAE